MTKWTTAHNYLILPFPSRIKNQKEQLCSSDGCIWFQPMSEVLGERMVFDMVPFVCLGRIRRGIMHVLINI